VFSAASFFDVVEAAGPAAPLLSEPVEPPPRPAVVAFYGFRGGAGRTLALAHVAMMLARRGLRVVAIDLDVEAPGLHVALGLELPAETRGVVSLLRQAATTSESERLDVGRHLLAAPAADTLGKVLMLPAGSLTREYLAQIEELGVALWHVQDKSPVLRLFEELRGTEGVDAILVDCRTGFSGLSATILYHMSDLVVVLFPLSDQIWEGIGILLEAARSAKVLRKNRPALLFVPSMVPAGEAGRSKTAAFLDRLRILYTSKVGPLIADPDGEDPDTPVEPWLTEGISYDPRIAAAGAVDPALLPSGAWGIYQELTESLASSLGVATAGVTTEAIDARTILDEITIDKALAFGEEPTLAELMEHFVAPLDVNAAVDRATALVVGAKGSGKTWLWRYLVNGGAGGAVSLPRDLKFVVGHAPTGAREAASIEISADGFKELERGAGMVASGTYKAFWLFYGLARACRDVEGLAAQLEAVPAGKERKLLRALLQADATGPLLKALQSLLHLPGAGSLAETVFQTVDSFLVTGDQSVCLAYDGLDTGFQTGKAGAWVERRERFVTALLQVIAEWRNRLRRVHFKVFLREDIFLSVKMQNRSHLEATKHELRWRPGDMWRIALNVAATSATYHRLIQQTVRGVEKPWPVDDDQLKRLLFPFWGEHVERGKRAYTANYIQKRTSDAADRLFPRTLVQVLHAAIEQERKSSSRGPSDRVIRYTSLRDGVAKASVQRVEDLQKEYVELAPYLTALKGADAGGTEKAFIEHMKKAFQRNKETGTLHLGQGGWRRVIERLGDVGVLGKPKRGREASEDRLVVALLYRQGLDVKSRGLV